MSVKVTAILKKESSVDPKNPKNRVFRASLSLLDENGKEIDLPKYLSGFDEMAKLLICEAGVTHQQLQDRFPRYGSGQDVRLYLTLENEDAIKRLGFNPSGT
jgi:hypothetical protein